MDQRPVGPDSGLQPSPAKRAEARPQRRPDAPEASQSPAFHVLLERLSRSARELQENAEKVERPSDLAGAMGRAKESLADALELGDQLLEAWRAERTNDSPEQTPKSDR